MILLDRFVTTSESCAYLPHETSRLLYEVVADLSPDEYETLINTGWRKFGAYLYRPVCLSCRECRPLRVKADEFTPDRSQRRAIDANADLIVRVTHPPVADNIRTDLYNRYQVAQTGAKGWEPAEKTVAEYAESLVRNPLPTGIEISIWQDETLVAVALVEVTPSTVSGVYHYHDPGESWRKRSLGTFTLLQTVALAQRLRKPFAYFGYYVAGCGSLNYKARFKPCEIQTETGDWEPVV